MQGRLAAGDRPWALAAGLWLAVVLTVAVHQWSFWRDARLDTDVLALLPQDGRAPDVAATAARQLADRRSRRIVVMVGAPSWEGARLGAAAWRAAVQDVPWQEAARADDASLSHALEFYRPWRDRLLTSEQQRRLQESALPSLVQGALAALHQPGSVRGLSQWTSDPLGLWPQWWSQRAGEIRARPRDGELALSADGLEWIALAYDSGAPAFALDGSRPHADAIDAARDAAQVAVPGVRVLATGVPLHAEAAAARASLEVNTIGWGSLCSVLLLVALAFRSLKPVALVALSLVVGVACALSVTVWVYGSAHVMTLVFGASLVGVAEDYGIHYFAARQGRPEAAPRTLMRHLAPGLVLALATSVLGYLALGLAPFPGLRQMALFSAVGLVGAFLTALCWFPILDRGPVRRSRFADAIAGSLARWPRAGRNRRWLLAYAATSAAALGGLAQLRVDDGIRQLQPASTPLVQAQREIGRLLGVASPVQFYVVRGESAEEVLEREEALKARLDGLVGYRALSDWVPSRERQRTSGALTARVESQVALAVAAALGEQLERPSFAEQPLTLERWLADPVSAPARDLWLGRSDDDSHASVVMLRDLQDPALLPRLAAAGDGLPGVRWVDRTAEVSSLLGRYRVATARLLLLGHAAVLLVLLWRYGHAAWRAWLPTALASVLALALLSALGQPLQLFNVLALLLLLGVGLDYGIFLLEHRGDGAAWLAVVIGAASTWLAFGLLALSSTPALSAFGSTLLIGLVLVGLLTPALRAPSSS
jgi:predicted exporter